MLYTHFTQEILGLQEVIVTNIETSSETLTIYAELERKSHSISEFWQGHQRCSVDGAEKVV